jgi:hypothetical protein
MTDFQSRDQPRKQKKHPMFFPKVPHANNRFSLFCLVFPAAISVAPLKKSDPNDYDFNTNLIFDKLGFYYHYQNPRKYRIFSAKTYRKISLKKTTNILEI